MTTPKPPGGGGISTPKPLGGGGISTPKPPGGPGGMTPGLSAFTFSPATHSPAGNLAQQLRHRGSPAYLPLTFTPNSAAVAEVVAQLGNYAAGGAAGVVRTPAFLQGQGGLGLPPDENKKRELEEILRTLETVPGRISVEGIERLVKRLGLECSIEAENTMSVIGKFIVVDIVFAGNNIKQVALTYGETNPSDSLSPLPYAKTSGPSNDLAPRAAAILLKNLQPNKPLLISSLKDFAGNLERLRKLDKLSQAPSTNYFAAITGLYSSLQKIFEFESRTMEGGQVDAMCKGNGRPRMHYAGKVGLSVEFWRLKRKVRGVLGKAEVDEGEGPDEDLSGGGSEAGEKEGDDSPTGAGKKMWRVLIEVDQLGPECASLDPVRISEDWVNIKPSEDSMFGDEYVIDWLDPEPTVENLMEVDSDLGSPRFIARLDPFIVVPLYDEVTIFTNLGLYSPPGQIGPTTLDGLLFKRPAPPLGQELPPLSAVRKVWVPNHVAGREKGKGKGEGEGEGGKDDEEEDGKMVVHKYYLHTLKPIYAREVWEVPFAHPKQLGPILQIFRQYVLVTTLLQSCFKTYDRPPTSISTTDTTSTSTAPPPSTTNTQPTTTTNTTSSHPPPPSQTDTLDDLDDLDAFLSAPLSSLLNPNEVQVDISLSADPPTLKCIFPSMATPGRLIHLEVEVGPNAVVSARFAVVDTPEWVKEHGHGGVGAGAGAGEPAGPPGGVTEEMVTMAVEAGEDLGIVVEWLRRRV